MTDLQQKEETLTFEEEVNKIIKNYFDGINQIDEKYKINKAPTSAYEEKKECKKRS